MTERVRGLVVNILDVSDSLRYVHMITLEKGRLSAGVRGSMKFRGRFGVAIMPMTYSEFVLYSSDGSSYWQIRWDAYSSSAAMPRSQMAAARVSQT